MGGRSKRKETMETYIILRDLAIIILAAKFMGLVAKKCRIPAVAGEIVAGLIIGPCLLGWVKPSDFISQMAETEGVDEQLKASDQLGWISRMNSIRQRAEETVLNELIFD